MSELRSAIDALRTETLAEFPDARLEEDFAELHRAAEQLELERLRRLAEIERRKLFERDGHNSAASWPAAQLVEAATIHAVDDLRRVVEHWRQVVAREHVFAGDEPSHTRRRLHASVTFGGMVRVDGDLDPESGESSLTALDAVLDVESHRSRQTDPDVRSAAQRRADALGEICRQWLDRRDRPTVAGERPHVIVTLGVHQLAPELDHVGAIPAATARRLACDASVIRVVMSAGSEPLDVGRRTPVVSAPIRRAVIARDRHCRFPGCDRPQAWCDAHHVVHWADGGETAVRNLVLLCRRHHRLVHGQGGSQLRIEHGRPAFRRPDGSVIEDRGLP